MELFNEEDESDDDEFDEYAEGDTTGATKSPPTAAAASTSVPRLRSHAARAHSEFPVLPPPPL